MPKSLNSLVKYQYLAFVHNFLAGRILCAEIQLIFCKSDMSLASQKAYFALHPEQLHALVLKHLSKEDLINLINAKRKGEDHSDSGTILFYTFQTFLYILFLLTVL